MKRAAICTTAVAFAALLVTALLELAFTQQPARVELRAEVARALPQSGVEHPVSAVLLNFRGYDTLLEIAVLLLALVIVLACGVDAQRGRPHTADVVLQTLARVAAPLMVIVAVYVVWIGAYRPGGAFQAAALLAAAALLLHLSGLLHSWQAPAFLLRCGLAGGLLVFLGVAAALLLTEGALLQYPPSHAGELIVFIEFSLAFSLGLLLAGLFLLLAREPGDAA